MNSLEPERGLEGEGKDLLWQSANAAVALRLVGVVYEAGSALYSVYRAEEAAVGFASTLEPALGEISASTLSDLEGSFGSGVGDFEYPKNLDTLNKYFASMEQNSNLGVRVKNIDILRDASKFVNRYGGKPEDWVKMSSYKYSSIDEQTEFETHWVENDKTGQKVESKTVLDKLNGFKFDKNKGMWK